MEVLISGVEAGLVVKRAENLRKYTFGQITRSCLVIFAVLCTKNVLSWLKFLSKFCF